MSTQHPNGQGEYPDERESELSAVRTSKRARTPSSLRDPSRRPVDKADAVSGGITRQQLLFILVVNAVISALISLCLVLLLRGQPIPSAGEMVTADMEAVVVSAAPETVGPNLPSATATGVPQQGATGVVAGEATATPEPIIHVVKPGDTISGLAFKYDVPEEQIMRANRLKNPNLLQMGAELIIPIGGLPETGETLRAVASATSSPIPFEPPSVELTATVERVAAESAATTTPIPSRQLAAGQLQIEIAEVVRPGVIESEGVFLINIGNQRADLQGWTLTDANENEYIFPNLRLWQGGSLMVYSREGTDDPPSSFFWGKTKAVWSPGEVATLKDAEGSVVATFTVNP